MKLLISILLISIGTVQLNGQSIKVNSIDSTKIMFKSKLLTTSEYGLGSKDEILKDIENQEAIFLETKYDNFIFVKVDFNQQYRLLDHSTSTLNRDCSYYLAFSIIDSRFYRLGGFDVIDIDDFFRDLKLREGTIFRDIIEGQEIEKIDIYCLYDYYELSMKKRLKKGFKCLENCSDKTKTKIIID